MNTGLLGKKLGMTRIFTEEGRWIDVTVLEAGPCTVVQRKTKTGDGYEAVQLGFGKKKKESRCTKPVLGHFKKAGAEPRPVLCEFRVAEGDPLKTGDMLRADLFQVGDHVDVAGTSKGRGFAGMVKRYGFKGGPGTHGSNFHRRAGSIGSSADPSKVMKGMRMAGHMGSARVTIQNLEVVKVDSEKNLLVVRGCVPGPMGGVIEVTKTVKGS
jgi:large subunit ribosomal protein L3